MWNEMSFPSIYMQTGLKDKVMQVVQKTFKHLYNCQSRIIFRNGSQNTCSLTVILYLFFFGLELLAPFRDVTLIL